MGIKKRKVVYYYPGEISSNSDRASVKRPYETKTWLEKNRECKVLSGNIARRIQGLRSILDDREFDYGNSYMLMDSINMPIFLRDYRDGILSSLTELYLLFKCRSRGLKIAFFYRDLYWRDSAFRDVYSVKWWFKQTFSWLEWHLVRTNVDLFCLPTTGISRLLPKSAVSKMEFLPGIIEKKGFKGFKRLKDKESYELFYVGGLKPPFYNIEELIEIANLPYVNLTIVCREDEWINLKSRLNSVDHISVHHRKSDELAEFYANADFLIDLRRNNGYYSLAFPYKYIESVSYGVPVLVYSYGEAGRIVGKHKLGVTVESLDEVKELFTSGCIDCLQDLFATADEFKNLTWESRFLNLEKMLFNI